jgi:tRNA threonylcarbamoyladenosine biosynthesis protein TsaB
VNVLALDGALGEFSVAVVADESVRAARRKAGNVALERGLSLVSDVLAETKLAPSAIGRIATGCGPGGFTGLRIAIAYAKSLAQAWNRPLTAIDSFDALEYGLELESALTVVVGRPGVISARYRSSAVAVRASGWIADVLDQIAPSLDSAGRQPLPVVGAPKDVLAALAERAMVIRSVDPMVTPVASAIGLLASSRPPARSLHEVRADYGELPAAKVPKR